MSAAIVGTSASPIGQVRPPDPTAAAWSELVHLDQAVRVGTGWRETAGLPLKRARRVCSELVELPHAS